MVFNAFTTVLRGKMGGEQLGGGGLIVVQGSDLPVAVGVLVVGIKDDLGGGPWQGLGVDVELVHLDFGHRLALGVGGTKSDHRRGDQEDARSQQRSVEPRGERVGQGDVADEQVVGARGGNGGEDRQPESGAELEGGADQGGGQTGFVGGYAGVGSGL